MKNILNNPTLRTLIMLATIVVLIMLYWSSCQKRIEDKKVYEGNQEAMKKEIVVQKNKNG